MTIAGTIRTAVLVALVASPRAAVFAQDDAVARLAIEVAGKGWIACSARSEAGDWDIFLCRPDGSQRRNLTGTRDANEGYPMFSRDGTRLLYRRLKRNEGFDGNRYGEQGECVISRSNGAEPQALGGEGEWPWATWSPDGGTLACLSVKGISFRDIETGRELRKLPRSGFFQQLTWSPDGRWLSGVSNGFGTGWSDARMDAATGATNPVSRVDCCTPDWFPDSQRMIFSNRPESQAANSGYGWTQLWMAGADGSHAQLVYAEEGRHIYGGHVSPDGLYVLFTGNAQEDGDASGNGAPMGLMRLSDAPIVGGESPSLRKLHQTAKSGPVLILPAGWEPCWTLSESPGNAKP